MAAEAAVAIVGGLAALGGVLASALGATKRSVWVLWINFGGNMVAKGRPTVPEAEKLQALLRRKGHASVIVTKNPDGTFECSHSVSVPKDIRMMKKRRARSRPM